MKLLDPIVDDLLGLTSNWKEAGVEGLAVLGIHLEAIEIDAGVGKVDITEA